MPGGEEVSVEPQFVSLPSKRLEVKNYIVGSGRTSKSQFMGVKQSGPCKRPQNICFCTTASEIVYITATDCEIKMDGTKGLQAAGAGGL